MTGIEIRSAAFENQAFIPGRHARDGDNTSPPLEWSGVPEDAVELLLMCEDPDAPSGAFLHWLVTGIDASVTAVAQGRVPEGAKEWPNDFGDAGWGGPQPPRGDKPHRYFVRLYALPDPIRLGDKPSVAEVHHRVDGRALAEGALVGLYQR